VLGQTLAELELIAVDDASQDDTPAILERFARTDPRVRIIVNEHKLGVSESRNRGWRAAWAPYVASQDSDDISLPDRLRRQADFLDAHPRIAAVGAAVITIDGGGRRLTTRRNPTKPRVIASTLTRRNCLAAASVTMRRTALEAVGGYRFERNEDYDLWLRFSELYDLANLPEPLALYRVHASQTSIVMLEHQAREARAVAAAARVRRRSGVDPLAGVEKLTPEVIDQLEIDGDELSAAVEDELISQAAIMADVGQQSGADELLEQAARLLGPRAATAFAATRELRQAEALARARRPAAAARHVLRAFRRDPRRTYTLVTRWLGPRVPGGSLLRWT
jgi:hypothetical protein